jgi:hypothetical protein
MWLHFWLRKGPEHPLTLLKALKSYSFPSEMTNFLIICYVLHIEEFLEAINCICLNLCVRIRSLISGVKTRVPGENTLYSGFRLIGYSICQGKAIGLAEYSNSRPSYFQSHLTVVVDSTHQSVFLGTSNI